MNIKITDSWLREYLKTPARPQDLQKYLSLCGPSIERINTFEDETVYDIEVTTNRVDMASVWGVAQEAQAILPQFKVEAQLIQHPLADYKLENIKTTGTSPLQVELTDPSICTRFTAVLLKNVTIQKSPDLIRKRLEAVDIKSINNVIDFSNYMMVALGQPVHVFDYDKIQGGKMKMRLSKKGEKITTLDNKEVTLPGDDIVIEDGSGTLIDLCGIMGGLNSSVTQETKNVLLFVQTYDKRRIRRTSMTTGIRTVAATYFEKGLNEEQVGPVAAYGVELFEKYAGKPEVVGVTDLYPTPYKEKTISISMMDIQRLMGIQIDEMVVNQILKNLGFGVTVVSGMVNVTVPPQRKDDMEIKEDVVEEVARIYGYFNLPNNLSPLVYLRQPKEIEASFEMQKKIKLYLKHLGLHEVMNYSMVSKQMILDADLKIEDHLKLKSTISEEIEYMRSHLSPSLMKNVKDNEGKRERIELFEIAKTYKKNGNDLPVEKYKVGIMVNTGLNRAKGIAEALLRELNVEDYSVLPMSHVLYADGTAAELKLNGEKIGMFGNVKKIYHERAKIKSPVSFITFDLETLVYNAKQIPTYHPINAFAEVKLDLTFNKTQIPNFALSKERAMKASTYLTKVEFLNTYHDNISLRFYFQAMDRNLTEDEAKAELEKIKSSLSY